METGLYSCLFPSLSPLQLLAGPSWNPRIHPSGNSLDKGLSFHPRHKHQLICSPQPVTGMLELWAPLATLAPSILALPCPLALQPLGSG